MASPDHRTTKQTYSFAYPFDALAKMSRSFCRILKKVFLGWDAQQSRHENARKTIISTAK